MHAVGQRATAISMTITANKLYYDKVGANKSPSLLEAYDVLIGSSIDYERKHGVKLGRNRNSLNEAWQKYGCVAHLWTADELLQMGIAAGKISTSSDPEEVARRISFFLTSAKQSLSALGKIIPRGRTEPIFDLDNAFWVAEEIDRTLIIPPEEKLLDSITESSLAGIKQTIKKYKGSRNLGKKKMRQKLEETQD